MSIAMLSRRRVLHGLGLVPLAKLVGCGDDPGAIVPDAAGDAAIEGGDLCGPAAPAWASGGTAAMTAKACYPDPFAAGIAACAIASTTTAGPCTAPTSSRVDVSEGMAGLPVRLVLAIVRDATCAPVAGAIVEIWHTQRSGVYSGATPSPGFCSGGDAQAPSRNYFRGTQTTDAAGRVAFDTCFPGWYPGRCIHIHVGISVGGTSALVTQLYFPDALNREIFATHADYTTFGQPNTSNDADGIFRSAADPARHLLDIARMSDGAMLASKAIAIP